MHCQTQDNMAARVIEFVIICKLQRHNYYVWRKKKVTVASPVLIILMMIIVLLIITVFQEIIVLFFGHLGAKQRFIQKCYM